jgi:hypothetical protein
MPRVSFETLPDESRLWVFGVGRELDADEEESFLGAVDRFLDTWAAHGMPLRCSRDWRHGRFLLVAVDEASVPPSGCSIDAMVGVLKDQEGVLGVPIVDSSPVWFLHDDEIRRSSRPDFRRLVEEGSVGPEIVVFDNTVKRLTEERAGLWERPAHESWHGRVFFRDLD